VNILFTGALVRLLGEVEYSLYPTAGSLAAYISIFDFGLNNTISRYVAKYRQENDKQKESDLLAYPSCSTPRCRFHTLRRLLLLGHISFFIKDLKPEIWACKSAVPAAGGQRAVTLPLILLRLSGGL
jgi:hypothetical protein